MNESEFLKRICEGYVHCYRTLNISTRQTWTDVTQRELAFFASLGEMLGFYACMERDRIDLGWYDPDDKERPVLHLERERERDGYPAVLEKLLKSENKAKCVIAVLGWVLEKDIQEVHKQICARIGNRSIAVMSWYGPDKECPTGLRALVCSEGKLFSREARTQLDCAGFWYVHFDVPWELEGNVRSLDADAFGADEDWEGNNAAFRCPLCLKVYIVSGLLHKDGRPCPGCRQSVGRVTGGRESGGQATLEWPKQEAEGHF